MPGGWDDRAVEAWRALAARGMRVRHGGVRVVEPRGLRAVPVWPFSQVLHATAAVTALDPGAVRTYDHLVDSLATYASGPAYAERPGADRRYYDDNAWVALAMLERGRPRESADVRRVLDFLREGAVELPDGSVGVRWVEGGEPLHACSTGGTGQVAAALGERDLAQRCASFLVGLADDRGLVHDHRRPDGSTDPSHHVYNQGLAIGLLVAVDRVADAQRLAAAAVGAYDVDALWREPAAFVAILLRELVELHRVDADDRWTAYAADHLDRVWSRARDPRTGLLSAGGMARYDRGVLLDHAALVAAMAALGSVARTA
jgi:hypothetical protein